MFPKVGWPWEETGPGRAWQLAPVTHGDEEVAWEGPVALQGSGQAEKPVG